MSRRYDADRAECLVLAFREGLLAAVGHDVALRVGRFTVDIGDDDAISAELDAASLRVAGAAVSPADARKIERSTATDVLEARRFPLIRFRSTRVVRDGERARVDGELTLHGVTRPLAFDAVADEGDWHAEVRLDQRHFGIKPYVALLGALRVRAELLVRLRLPRA